MYLVRASWPTGADKVIWGQGKHFYPPFPCITCEVTCAIAAPDTTQVACEKKLDTMFDLPPKFEVGTYGSVIHEMTEMERAPPHFGQYVVFRGWPKTVGLENVQGEGV